ncbi:hypothetical protein [Moorena sp. SIO2C4]|uniref:hypothetical protein n=1 Tax=Moorena sp. SIO2C4 TaxID=2607824 RepID=UPI0013CADD82|nr:hypothetical protein [Moorena sp. SIO2C4]NES43627.1 hypothetical protein [Moorena sp. SIO2C4]
MSKLYTLYQDKFPYYVTKSHEEAKARFAEDVAIAQATQDKILPKKYTSDEIFNYDDQIFESNYGKVSVGFTKWLQKKLLTNQNKDIMYFVGLDYLKFRTFDVECAVHLLKQLNEEAFIIHFHISNYQDRTR